MASSDPRRKTPLAGVRVLSFGSFVAGNICTLMLADLGADVVKIESRDRPEALRAYDNPGQPQVFEPSGMRTTALFAGMTRGVRSACINMGNERGRHTFRELAERAHVVIENLGLGTMESWGCSYPELHMRNTNLVMLSISGYGRSGPQAAYRAYASNINSFLGHARAWAPDGIHFDFVAGIHGACAVVAGLAEIDGGAPGVFIDMAQTEAGAAILPTLYLDFLANRREWSEVSNEVPGSCFSGVVRCRGADSWVAIELEDARDWAIMCEFLERPDLTLGAQGATREARASLRDAVASWASTVTPFQAAFRLQRLGVAAGPVEDNEDLWRDAQHRSRGAYVDVWHPDLGRIEYPDSPGALHGTPGEVRPSGPRLGAHTVDVLREWLGCNESDVAGLRASAAVWAPEEAALEPRSRQGAG